MTGVAPQHRGGSNATTIGMVVSIIVAVLLLVALILLFTQQEQLRMTAEQATRAKERLARGNEEAAAKQMFPEASGPGRTLVGEMTKGFQLVCGRMTGNQNDAPQAAVKALDLVLEEIKDSVPDPERVSSAYGAVTIVKNLHRMFADELAARQKAEADLEKASADLEAVRVANEELGKNFSAELTKLSARVAELQQAEAEFERVKGAEVAALARQIDEKQDALDTVRRHQSKLLRKFRQEISRRDQSIEEQSQALARYRGQGTAHAAEPLAIAREPVGTVLRALPGDSLVHVDLGKQDKVALGMTFSVYSAGERVRPDGRGKANIEVVGLGERTAECKVTTPPSPDDPILPNDRVGNIVLSRNRAKKTRICVLGEFDIDGDGQVDARGAEAIRALAERYGAAVVDEVDAMTDYLVIGREPPPTADDYVADEAAAEEEDEYDEEDEEEGEDIEAVEEEEEDEGEDEYDEDEYDEGEDVEADEDEGEDEYDEEDEDEDESDEDEEDEAVAPRIPRAVEIDPTVTPRRRRAKSEREKYFEAIRRAEMFAIPRLRQDQFFNFIGIELGPDTAERMLR